LAAFTADVAFFVGATFLAVVGAVFLAADTEVFLVEAAGVSDDFCVLGMA
jgi:hypothetical protein